MDVLQHETDIYGQHTPAHTNYGQGTPGIMLIRIFSMLAN